jgi:hypothetical protein
MLGKRYGKLPSEILSSATTLDLQVLDISISYENQRIAEIQGKTLEPTVDQMKAAMEQIKGVKNESQS